ncbi:MAG: hypothetical protein HKN09_09125 [Saprospiraceae bacterium]|nr:hypothetical protein [Saprospiraceae bacterium]
MKGILTLLIAVISISVYGQVEETKHLLSFGHQNGYVIEHDGADEKMVYKFLEDHYKKYGKVKRNKKAGEWSCESCQIGVISSSPMDVYFKVKEGKGLTSSYHFFDEGTQFISSENSADASKKINNFLTNVFYEVKRDVIKMELEEEEKILKDFEKDLSKLEKKNKDLHEDIEDYKKKIIEAEEDIEKNLEEQADMKMSIEKQTRNVSEITKKLNNVGKG